MKRVLFISENLSLREYLCEKLISGEVQVEVQSERRQALIKMMAFRPDLVVFDADIPFKEMTVFLAEKSDCPVVARIPVIIIGDSIEREDLLKLSVHSVIKYFVKPLKIDIFFDLVGRILGVKIPIDKTQCVVDMHVEKSVIFIEVSRGLNQEKLILMRFRLREIAERYKLETPQIVLIISDIHLSFIDVSNLEMLLQNILKFNRIEATNIKLLTTDPFIKKLIAGHPAYSKIEIIQDLSLFIGDSMLDDASSEISGAPDAPESDLNDEEKRKLSKNSLRLRFLSDFVDSEESRKNTKIAVVQENRSDRDDLEKALKKRGYSVMTFAENVDFLLVAKMANFDVVILDDSTKGMTTFDVLVQLNSVNALTLIYSNALGGNARKKLEQAGISAFLVKPDDSCKDVADKIHELLLERA